MPQCLPTQEDVIARLERLPMTGWYIRIMLVGGISGAFDAFDTFTIAFVLPVLVELWHFDAKAAGFLVSIGYVGHLCGTLGLSWVAERHGRLRVLRWTLIIFGIMSLACGFAWNYVSLFWLRLVQGIGLGAEGPVAVVYMNEFTKARYRGRMITLFQAIFGLGALLVSWVALLVVPTFGWQWMFFIGAVPALLGAAMRRLVPESPRWLASHGRLEEAGRVLGAIEDEASRHGMRPLPAPATNIPAVSTEHAGWASLFTPFYRARTLSVWCMAFAMALTSYGLQTWMPLTLRTVYHLPLREALHDAFIFTILSTLGSWGSITMLDSIGRRASYLISFLGGALPLLVLWRLGAGASPNQVLVLAGISRFFVAIVTVSIWVYITEIFPTRMRSIGSGSASAFVRIASILGPAVVGLMLEDVGIGSVFLLFGATSLAAAVIVFFFCVETRGRIAEEVAP